MLRPNGAFRYDDALPSLPPLTAPLWAAAEVAGFSISLQYLLGGVRAITLTIFPFL